MKKENYDRKILDLNYSISFGAIAGFIAVDVGKNFFVYFCLGTLIYFTLIYLRNSKV